MASTSGLWPSDSNSNPGNAFKPIVNWSKWVERKEGDDKEKVRVLLATFPNATPAKGERRASVAERPLSDHRNVCLGNTPHGKEVEATVQYNAYRLRLKRLLDYARSTYLPTCCLFNLVSLL